MTTSCQAHTHPTDSPSEDLLRLEIVQNFAEDNKTRLRGRQVLELHWVEHCGIRLQYWPYNILIVDVYMSGLHVKDCRDKLRAATSPRILFSFATKFYWTRNSTIGMFNTDQESLVMIPTIS